MNKNTDNTEADIGQIENDGSDAPQWVSDLLGQFHGSAPFRERCRDAAVAAHAVAMMRREQERTGFAALSFARYVRGLAEITKVSLQPVLRWADIEDLEKVSPHAASAMARLAREIGLSPRQTEVMLRIGITERLGYASFPLAVRRNEYRRGDGVDACATELEAIESQYPLAAREDVRLVVEAVEREYMR